MYTQNMILEHKRKKILKECISDVLSSGVINDLDNQDIFFMYINVDFSEK